MYFFPLDAATEAALQDKWQEVTASEQPATVANTAIEVMFGRTLQVTFFMILITFWHGHHVLTLVLP